MRLMNISFAEYLLASSIFLLIAVLALGACFFAYKHTKDFVLHTMPFRAAQNIVYPELNVRYCIWKILLAMLNATTALLLLYLNFWVGIFILGYPIFPNI